MDEDSYAIDVYDDWGYFYEMEPEPFYKPEPVYSIELPNTPLHLDEEWGHFVEIDNYDAPKINYSNAPKINIQYKNDNYEKPQNNSLATSFLIRISSTTLFTMGLTYLILSIL